MSDTEIQSPADQPTERAEPKHRRHRSRKHGQAEPTSMAEMVDAAKEKLGAEVVQQAPQLLPEEPPPVQGHAAGQATHPAQPTDQAPRVTLPDPHCADTIALTAEKHGPRMYLSRSHRFRQMQMAFDQHPGEDALQVLRDQGWIWKQKEKAWTRQLERGAEWRDVMDAERLFKDIANTLRQQNGLEPVSELRR